MGISVEEDKIEVKNQASIDDEDYSASMAKEEYDSKTASLCSDEITKNGMQISD